MSEAVENLQLEARSLLSLPDETIIQILSALPVDDPASVLTILAMRLVCQRLLRVASSPYLFEDHLQWAYPIDYVLVVVGEESEIELERRSLNDKDLKILLRKIVSASHGRAALFDEVCETYEMDAAQLLGNASKVTSAVDPESWLATRFWAREARQMLFRHDALTKWARGFAQPEMMDLKKAVDQVGGFSSYIGQNPVALELGMTIKSTELIQEFVRPEMEDWGARKVATGLWEFLKSKGYAERDGVVQTAFLNCLIFEPFFKASGHIFETSMSTMLIFIAALSKMEDVFQHVWMSHSSASVLFIGPKSQDDTMFYFDLDQEEVCDVQTLRRRYGPDAGFGEESDSPDSLVLKVASTALMAVRMAQHIINRFTLDPAFDFTTGSPNFDNFERSAHIATHHLRLVKQATEFRQKVKDFHLLHGEGVQLVVPDFEIIAKRHSIYEATMVKRVIEVVGGKEFVERVKWVSDENEDAIDLIPPTGLELERPHPDCFEIGTVVRSDMNDPAVVVGYRVFQTGQDGDPPISIRFEAKSLERPAIPLEKVAYICLTIDDIEYTVEHETLVSRGRGENLEDAVDQLCECLSIGQYFLRVKDREQGVFEPYAQGRWPRSKEVTL